MSHRRFLERPGHVLDAASYYRQANAHLDEGDPKQAIKDYSLQPDNVEAFVNRGLANQDNICHAEAIADFDRAIWLAPNNAEAYLYRGRSHLWRPAQARDP